MEKVFNDEMLYDDPSDKDKKAFKQKYSGKKCLRVIYRNTLFARVDSLVFVEYF